MRREEQNLSDGKMLRKFAEEELKKVNKEDNPGFEADSKKLLHELQVHQIELEMMNEMLLQANGTAEQALKKYTMLYDFSPMGYFTLDNDCSIRDLNFTGAEMLGDKRFSLENTNFKLFVTEKSLPAFNTFFDTLFSSNAKESCEVTLGYDNKILCEVYMEGIVTGDDRKCLLSVVDISNFKKK